MRIERGQAAVEFAISLGALALVVGFLCSFAYYIVHSLEVQNSLRGDDPKDGESVEINFGSYSGELKVEEKAVLPARTL